MEKIDRLGWAAGRCFDAYGVRVGVRLNQPELLSRVSALFPPGWKPLGSSIVDQMYSLWLGTSRGRTRGYHLVYSGITRRARTLDLDTALATFESDLRLNVAASARRRIFMHAGVVGYRGRAILVPGRSFAGKTTLVAELVRLGALYYSDEFAVLDARGRVHPFAKRLSIRESDGARVRSCPVEELGGRAGARALPVGLIVLTSYRPGARWRSARLSHGRSLLELVAHTVPVRRRPEASLLALERAVEGALVLKGTRGDAAETAAALIALLEEADRGRGTGTARKETHEA
jgi:hypothetical protein